MQQNLAESLVEAVNNFTRHTHENRHEVEGWKTNAGHMLNKKFIVNSIFELSWTKGIEMRYCAKVDHLRDLIKALCNIKGIDYSKTMDLREKCKQIDTNTWIETDFFMVKGFKKGTGHFKFKSLEDWKLLNTEYARALGCDLPEKL